MRPSAFNAVRKEVWNVLPNSPLKAELTHSKLVHKWVLALKPDADEALQIAAIAHDLDRGVTGITEKDRKENEDYNEFKKQHSIRSAKFIAEIMHKHAYAEDAIRKVVHLVENHEFGGDAETNVLTDADSLAFFEYNVPEMIERNGRERALKKVKFMYERLSTPKAKKLVLGMKHADANVSALIKEALA